MPRFSDYYKNLTPRDPQEFSMEDLKVRWLRSESVTFSKEFRNLELLYLILNDYEYDYLVWSNLNYNIEMSFSKLQSSMKHQQLYKQYL